MAKLLHVIASPRNQRSVSSRVAAAFLAEYRQRRPADQVEVLHLWETRLAEFDATAAAGKYHIMAGKPFTPEEKTAWEGVLARIDQLKAADKLLISSPMWNFGIPYRLKQWIDLVVQPGHTFSYSAADGYTGLVTGRPAQLILARGSAYPPGSDMAPMDFQRPYLEMVLGFIGFTDVRTLAIEPAMAFTDKDLAEAEGKARAAAAAF